MPMKNPPHPGESIRADCLEPLGLTVTDTVKALGVSRQALNNLINGQPGILCLVEGPAVIFHTF